MFSDFADPNHPKMASSIGQECILVDLVLTPHSPTAGSEGLPEECILQAIQTMKLLSQGEFWMTMAFGGFAKDLVGSFEAMGDHCGHLFGEHEETMMYNQHTNQFCMFNSHPTVALPYVTSIYRALRFANRMDSFVELLATSFGWSQEIEQPNMAEYVHFLATTKGRFTGTQTTMDSMIEYRSMEKESNTIFTLLELPTNVQDKLVYAGVGSSDPVKSKRFRLWASGETTLGKQPSLLLYLHSLYVAQRKINSVAVEQGRKKKKLHVTVRSLTTGQNRVLNTAEYKTARECGIYIRIFYTDF
jgi:hypothetical protein